jgi:HEAT repeat protein
MPVFPTTVILSVRIGRLIGSGKGDRTPQLKGLVPCCPAAAEKDLGTMRKLPVLIMVVLIAGCGKKEKSYSVETMIEDLNDPNPGVRYTAVETLGDYGRKAESAVPGLIKALKDEDKNVRMRAAYSLAEILPAGQTAIPALKEALKDKEELVRKAAAYSLKRIRRKLNLPDADDE